MAKIVKQGNKVKCWIDSNGVAVPLSYIPQNVQERDKIVVDCVQKAEKLQSDIAKIKKEISGMIEGYLTDLAKEHGENWQGNAELVDFAGEQGVSVKVNKILGFDEKLQVAKTKIDNCIKAWSKGASSKIIALVNQAFAVDSKGKLDARKILGLRSLEIEDEAWKEAMELIAESVKTERTKTYVSFFRRDEEGNKKAIVLNFSSL